MRNVRRPRADRLAIGLRLLFAALVVVLGATIAPRAAHAAGTVTIANLSPTENNGRWKLQMTINYGSTPHIGHVPMLFIFTPTMLYERALTDQTGDRPILNKVPLKNQQSINESMDVGFSDASGKVFSTTKFDFVVNRDRGFEAGEYTLEIKRADDGARMGNIQKLKLMGDNPIVDRRAMVFSGEKKEKKATGDAAKPADDSAEKKTEEAPAEADSKPAEEPAAETETAPAPPPVPPQQGGCGCRTASGDDSSAGFAALALGAALIALRGAKRRAAARS